MSARSTGAKPARKRSIDRDFDLAMMRVLAEEARVSLSIANQLASEIEYSDGRIAILQKALTSADRVFAEIVSRLKS